MPTTNWGVFGGLGVGSPRSRKLDMEVDASKIQIALIGSSRLSMMFTRVGAARLLSQSNVVTGGAPVQFAVRQTRAACDCDQLGRGVVSLEPGRFQFRRVFGPYSSFHCTAVAIEDSIASFIRRQARSQKKCQLPAASLSVWSARRHLPIHSARDRDHGRTTTQKLLLLPWRYHGEACRGCCQ